jgi:hypothetical protein
MPEVIVLHLALGQGATLATTDKALAAEAKKHARGPKPQLSRGRFAARGIVIPSPHQARAARGLRTLDQLSHPWWIGPGRSLSREGTS